MKSKQVEIRVGEEKVTWFAMQMNRLAQRNDIPPEVTKLSAEIFTNSIAEATNSEPYANIIGFYDNENNKYWGETLPGITKEDTNKLNNASPKQRRKILRKYLKIAN